MHKLEVTASVVNLAAATADGAIQWPEAFLWVGLSFAGAFLVVGLVWAATR